MRLFVSWVLRALCVLAVVVVPKAAWACVTDDDCDTGEVCCDDGNCYADGCPTSGGCTSDSDCDTGECCGSDGSCSSDNCDSSPPSCDSPDVTCSDGSCCPSDAPVCCPDGCSTSTSCVTIVQPIGGKAGGPNWGCDVSSQGQRPTWLAVVGVAVALALASRKSGKRGGR